MELTRNSIEYKYCFDIEFSTYTFRYGSISCLFDTGASICVWKGNVESFVRLFGNSYTGRSVHMISYDGNILLADVYLMTLRFGYLTCKHVPVAIGKHMPINKNSTHMLTLSPRIVFDDVNLLYDVKASKMLIGLPDGKKYLSRRVIIRDSDDYTASDIVVVNEEVDITQGICPACGSKLLSIGRCVNPDCYFEL